LPNRNWSLEKEKFMDDKTWGERTAERLTETESERNDRQNSEGYEDGKNASWGERFAHNIAGSGSSSYDGGFREGMNAEDDDDE
jgi:hypothetical protein